jgi:signal transduction histidine kinase
MPNPLAKGRLSNHIRDALAEVEAQRDEAVVYLSAIKLLLDVLARGHATRQCGQEIAECLVQQLALETCAVALCEARNAELVLAGFATQAQRLGGPRGALDESGWVALARLVKPGAEPTCFRRLDGGSFEAVAAGDLAGEGFCVLPFAIGGEAGGAIVLHSLIGPAQAFARGRALAIVAKIVGQVLTIARMRESVVTLCTDLEGELGVAPRVLSDHEENIQTLTQALIRSNRVKREFLGAVSHELRTPLNAILGYTSLMRDGMAGRLTDEQTTLLDRVLSNSRNLNWLIDDILFFVQIEADRVSIRRERIDVAELIDSVVAELPDIPGRPRVPLRVDLAAGASVLHVDGSLVRRLLFHLLSNAFKFTTAGEVRVTVRPDGIRAAVIAVRDTGVGIPPDRIADLFELFAQANGSTARRFHGLGIGLPLVQRCVRLLGGEVAVESVPGAGSEFRVRIPDALVAAGDDAPAAADSSVVH